MAELLERLRRSIRLKYLKDGARFERAPFLMASIPLVPIIIWDLLTEQRSTAWYIVSGFAAFAAIVIMLYMLWQMWAVDVRVIDKLYTRYLRKNLSKEYRDDDPSSES